MNGSAAKSYAWNRSEAQDGHADRVWHPPSGAGADAEARIRTENDALAHVYVAIKRAGLIARMVPLDDVVSEALVRDRKPGLDDDLPEFIASIRDVGLSNPIRVEERENGRYELIQGYRRLSAHRALRDEAGGAWAKILGRPSSPWGRYGGPLPTHGG